MGNDAGIVRALIMLPVRIAGHAARLGLRAAGDIGGAALRTAEELIDGAATPGVAPPGTERRGSPVQLDGRRTRREIHPPSTPPISLPTEEPLSGPSPRGRRPRTTSSRRGAARPASLRDREPRADGRPRGGEPRASRRAPAARRAAPPAEQPAPPSPEPEHVSRDAQLVESFADPGAEDGAGATVRVAEPWPGYRRLNARETVARLAASSQEEVAAVQLYEGLNRRRRTVLDAARRRLQELASLHSARDRT